MITETLIVAVVALTASVAILSYAVYKLQSDISKLKKLAVCNLLNGDPKLANRIRQEYECPKCGRTGPLKEFIGRVRSYSGKYEITVNCTRCGFIEIINE